MSSLSSNAGSSAGPRLTAAIIAAGFICFLNMWCTQAILPVLAAALHVSEGATGYTVTAPLLATAAMAPVAGILSDRFGRKRFIRGAALLLVIPTLLAACAPNLIFLVFCRFAQGLILPFIFTVTIAYIGEELDHAPALRLAGLYTSGSIMGGFSGRLLTGLITSWLDWRAAFIMIGLLTLAVAVFISTALPRERKFRPTTRISSTLRAFPMHLSNPQLLATYAVGIGVLFCLVCVFTFINFRLAVAPYHLGPAALGAIFVVYLGGVIINPLTARLAARLGRRIMLGISTLAVLAGLALTLAAPLWLICLGLVVFCCGIFAQQGLAIGFIGQAARGAKSTAAGLYVTFYYIGGSFGGSLPASAWHSVGWAGCVAFAAFMQIIIVGLALPFWRLPATQAAAL